MGFGDTGERGCDRYRGPSGGKLGFIYATGCDKHRKVLLERRSKGSCSASARNFHEIGHRGIEGKR